MAIDALGSVAHYQLEQIARVKKVDIDRVTVKPVQTLDAIARAIGANEIDGAIMPASYARELLASNQAKLVGWYSELDEIQAATTIARYVYPDRGTSGAVAVEASAYFIDPQAQLDIADIERQIAWYVHGQIDKTVSARDVVDPSFVK
ncbi:MAG: hypothetical protein WAM50_20245 [Pseudolabrys sp.]